MFMKYKIFLFIFNILIKTTKLKYQKSLFIFMGNIIYLCSFCGKNPDSFALKKTEISLQELEDSGKWVTHFNSQLKTLQKKHLWAKKLLNKLKYFKCLIPRRHYIGLVLNIYQRQQNLNSHSLIDQEEPKQKNMLISYENNSFVSSAPRKTEDGVDLYKDITGLIERHLKETQNSELAYLLSEFIEWFYTTYKSVLIVQHRKGLERKALEKNHRTSIENLQQFIRVFVESLMLYYQINKISNNGKLAVFSKENFINFITSLLFSSDKIYQIVFFMQKALDQSFEQKFQMILGFREHFEISDYLIPNKLWLVPEKRKKKSEKSKKMISQNDLTFFSFSSEFETPNRTFCYQDNFKHPTEFESFHSLKQEEVSIDRFNSFDDMISQSKPFLAKSQSRGLNLEEVNSEKEEKNQKNNLVIEKIPKIYHYKRKNSKPKSKTNIVEEETLEKLNVGFSETFKAKPFTDAIIILESIGEIRSPVHKMKKILTMVSNILHSTSSLSDSGNESEGLDQKSLFCILLYVVSQSKCSDLHTHLKMVEKFSTNNVLSSISGYYFTLLQLVVKFIEGLDCDMMIGENKKKYLGERIQEVSSELKQSILF